MVNLVFISFSAVQLYDLSYIHLPKNTTKCDVIIQDLNARTIRCGVERTNHEVTMPPKTN